MTSEEKKLESALGAAVKRAGGLSLKLWPISFSGLPDRMVLLPGGRIKFVEVKGPGKALKPRQKIVADKLTALGFEVYKLDNINQIDKILT